MQAGDGNNFPGRPKKLQVRLSLLCDYACIAESSYDDLYAEDGWKSAKFKRYRQANGLSPLDFLRHYNQLLELQQICRTAAQSAKAKTDLEQCVSAMHSALLEAAIDDNSKEDYTRASIVSDKHNVPPDQGRKLVLNKCTRVLRWLEANKHQLRPKQEYLSRKTALEDLYNAVFRERFFV